jgi:regulator of replication initiation timing
MWKPKVVTMKNKEIEEILEGIKVVIKHNGTLEFDVKELKILLSHIEQLETDYKEVNESVTWWTNRFNAIERDNRNLKNNRDKAIRILETLKGSARWEKHLYEVDYMLDILKGDSDE